jgi:hypothetical protein
MRESIDRGGEYIVSLKFPNSGDIDERYNGYIGIAVVVVL